MTRPGEVERTTNQNVDFFHFKMIKKNAQNVAMAFHVLDETGLKKNKIFTIYKVITTTVVEWANALLIFGFYSGPLLLSVVGLKPAVRNSPEGLLVLI